MTCGWPVACHTQVLHCQARALRSLSTTAWLRLCLRDQMGEASDLALQMGSVSVDLGHR